MRLPDEIRRERFPSLRRSPHPRAWTPAAARGRARPDLDSAREARHALRPKRSATSRRTSTTTKARLADLVRIPSVSAEGFPPEEVRRSAEATAALLREAGLENVRLLEMPGQHPYVYADWLHAEGAPTLLVYGHHDVQPPGRPEKWVDARPSSRPSATAASTAAGAVDDKGTFITHVAAVARLARDRGPAAAEPQAPHRGRGGDRLARPRGVPEAVRPAPRRRRGRARRHRQLRRGPPRPHLPAARHLPGGRRGALPGAAGPQRLLGRAGARRRADPRAASSPTSRAPTAR